MRRNEEDQEIVERGKLWIEFKTTAWFKDLSLFLNTQIETLKESVVMLTLNQQYEQAKAEAQLMAGFIEVRGYINNDAIDKMKALIEDESEDRKYQGEIPNHV